MRSYIYVLNEEDSDHSLYDNDDDDDDGELDNDISNNDEDNERLTL